VEFTIITVFLTEDEVLVGESYKISGRYLTLFVTADVWATTTGVIFSKQVFFNQRNSSI